MPAMMVYVCISCEIQVNSAAEVEEPSFNIFHFLSSFI